MTTCIVYWWSNLHGAPHATGPFADDAAARGWVRAQPWFMHGFWTIMALEAP